MNREEWRAFLKRDPTTVDDADLARAEMDARDFATCALGSQSPPWLIKVVSDTYEGLNASDDVGENVTILALDAEEFPSLLHRREFAEALALFDSIGQLARWVVSHDDGTLKELSGP